MRSQAFFSSRSLQTMNSSMSGWSTLRMTIFAARRVLPPDLMAPAKLSKPFMKETGPDAMPPEESDSVDERSEERFDPVPDPNLKSMPSVLARSRIEDIESPTALMKHADAWGFGSTPTLNQTGELKLAAWFTRMWASSSENVSRSAAVRKYPFFCPKPVMVSTTRPMSCLADRLRRGVPGFTCEHFSTTLLVAVIEHV